MTFHLLRLNFFESSLDFMDFFLSNFLSDKKVSIALSSCSLLSLSIKKPFLIFVISELPPTLVAIVGIPKLINSIKLLERPSSNEELIPTLVIFKKFLIFFVLFLKIK